MKEKDITLVSRDDPRRGKTDWAKVAKLTDEEIEIIASYLPQQMSEAEIRAAVEAAVAETGAAGLKDMGKVMAALKARHSGKMDFAKASGLVKARLAG